MSELMTAAEHPWWTALSSIPHAGPCPSWCTLGDGHKYDSDGPDGAIRAHSAEFGAHLPAMGVCLTTVEMWQAGEVTITEPSVEVFGDFSFSDPDDAMPLLTAITRARAALRDHLACAAEAGVQG
ncbi:hypothetical protein [Actinokineospora iranica]|uniref:Uncharacterized protein n=1 Tax=Actinokineospora iranica TaxID=1271860 RepID=A0A1G6MCQ8_9PSEU|nr:hypothetical protein [Actinokineospora iranica]SDC52766.1 hypothetical protein SAMN05216174_102463 [Actinokineospora iranica]